MESSKAGRRLCSSCPWDRSGSSLFHRILAMATAGLARSSAPARPSFLKLSCSPSRPRTKRNLRLHLRLLLRLRLRQNSSAQKVGSLLELDQEVYRNYLCCSRPSACSHSRTPACTPASSPKPENQRTPCSLRNQVSWRLAYCRVAC